VWGIPLQKQVMLTCHSRRVRIFAPVVLAEMLIARRRICQDFKTPALRLAGKPLTIAVLRGIVALLDESKTLLPTLPEEAAGTTARLISRSRTEKALPPTLYQVLRPFRVDWLHYFSELSRCCPAWMNGR
jgi:hypothetical protein